MKEKLFQLEINNKTIFGLYSKISKYDNQNQLFIKINIEYKCYIRLFTVAV